MRGAAALICLLHPIFLFISINELGLEELCLYLFNEVKGQGTVHGQILI